MTPLYFGTANRRLFGIYSPSRAADSRSKAVVLCPPWGDEYLRAHRALRHLASQLASAGVDVLRFAYFGTGDSGGDMPDAGVEGWLGDIEAAMEELRDTAGVSRVGLVGLRLGAILAASVAARGTPPVDSLVLWEPVGAGEDYVGELDRLASPSRGAPEGDREVLGFTLTRAMASELRNLDLAALAPALPARTLVLVSQPDQARPRWREALDGGTRGAPEVECIASPASWLEDDTYRSGAVPVEAIRRLVEWHR